MKGVFTNSHTGILYVQNSKGNSSELPTLTWLGKVGGIKKKGDHRILAIILCFLRKLLYILEENVLKLVADVNYGCKYCGKE